METTKNTNVKLRSNLKAMLDERKMSMREFANRIDYRFESVRQLCRNELLRIPVDLIERVCVELNCGVGELFTMEAAEDKEEESGAE